MAKKKSSKEGSRQLSSAIVKYLQDKGYLLKEIGGFMELSESSMSRVGNGERALRLGDLIKLEQSLGESISSIIRKARRKYPLDLS